MKLGFIGTGNITVAVVNGICGSKISFRKILVSPRNKGKALKLSKKFKFLFDNSKINVKVLNYNLSLFEKIHLFFFILFNNIFKIYILAPKKFYYFCLYFFLKLSFMPSVLIILKDIKDLHLS